VAAGRAVILAIGLALMPEACAKMFAKKAPPPPVEPDPIPSTVTTTPTTGATTPPVWHPPESGGTTAATTPDGAAPTGSGPVASPELVKARAASDAKDFKKVKTLLEKKARAGKGTPEENQLVFRACVALKDKACADAVKAKHPEDINE
jgi:hypothetical protein